LAPGQIAFLCRSGGRFHYPPAIENVDSVKVHKVMEFLNSSGTLTRSRAAAEKLLTPPTARPDFESGIELTASSLDREHEMEVLKQKFRGGKADI